jgi:hypothetical protein
LTATSPNPMLGQPAPVGYNDEYSVDRRNKAGSGRLRQPIPATTSYTVWHAQAYSRPEPATRPQRPKPALVGYIDRGARQAPRSRSARTPFSPENVTGILQKLGPFFRNTP